MSITRFIESGIGSRAKKRHHHRLRSLLGSWWHARPLRLQVAGEKLGEGNPDDPGQARMQVSIHEQSGGASVGPKGARSSLNALWDIT
jgi:hypothetical protein